MNQRTIKFRAWDKIGSKWIHDFRIHPQGTVFPAKAILDEPDGKFWLYERGNGVEIDCVLMQFTGLHDKNGKEVFEGDIMSDHSVVEFNNELTGFITSDLGEKPFYSVIWPYSVQAGMIEVIGDIYSNPDLLAKENI